MQPQSSLQFILALNVEEYGPAPTNNRLKRWLPALIVTR